MRRRVSAACVLAFVAVVAGCGGKSAPGETAAPADAGCSHPDGTNLLVNPSFEDGANLASGWINESSTSGKPTFTLSSTTGVADGQHAQRVQYTGQDGDDGKKKVEFYEGPVDGVTPGQIVQFSVCVSGVPNAALSKAYAIVGIEAFTSKKKYISDVSTNITTVDQTPTRFTSRYTVPDGASYLSVFVQSPEFTDVGAIDLYFDSASLVIVS